MDFWNKLPKPFVALAPMEGVTDAIFRHVVARAGRPDLFFTEFTNVASYASEKGRANALERLAFSDEEQPIIAQIWGKNPEFFETTAYGLRDMGYEAVDINMGCPDKNVVRTGGGSDLIRHPELAGEIIAATKKAGLPVSVKTRLGYSKVDEWQDWIKYLFSQDIVNLTIHLRTKREMSKVGAHFELIPEIIKMRDEVAPQTLVTINGDITDTLHALRVQREYPGVDGVMIGRGVFMNPFCFEREAREHSKEELIDLLRFHLSEFDKTAGAKFDPLKRFFKVYIRDFPNASEMRDEMMHAKTTDEVRAILDRA